MATIDVSIESKKAKSGADQVNRALNAIKKNTSDTAKTLNRIDKGLKRTGSSFKTQAKDIKKTRDTVVDYNKSLDSLSRATRLVDGPLGGIAARFQTLTGIIKTNAASVAAFTVALAAVGFAIKSSLGRFVPFETALLTTKAAFEATGRAAELTIEDFDKFAIALGRATLTSRTEILKTGAAIATFSNIATSDIKRIISLAQDLSATFGGDLAANAQRLARALQSPGQAFTLLERQIGKTTEAERAFLKALEETGQIVIAQSIIFEKFSEIEGRGEDQAQGLAGSFDSLGDAVTDLGIALATITGLSETANNAIKGLTSGIDSLAGSFSSLENILIGFTTIFGLRFLGSLRRSTSIITNTSNAVTGLGAGFLLLGGRSTEVVKRFGRVRGGVTLTGRAVLGLTAGIKGLIAFLGGPFTIAAGLAVAALLESRDSVLAEKIALDKSAKSLKIAIDLRDKITTATEEGAKQLKGNAKQLKTDTAETIKNNKAKIEELKIRRELFKFGKEGVRTRFSIISDEEIARLETANQQLEQANSILEKIVTVTLPEIDVVGAAAFAKLSKTAEAEFKKLANSIQGSLAKSIELGLEGRPIQAIKNFTKFMEKEFKATFARIAAAAARQQLVLPFVQSFAQGIGFGEAFKTAFPTFDAAGVPGGAGSIGGGLGSIINSIGGFLGGKALAATALGTQLNITAAGALPGLFAAPISAGGGVLAGTGGLGIAATSVIASAALLAIPLIFSSFFGGGTPHPAATFGGLIGPGGDIGLEPSNEFPRLGVRAKRLGEQFPRELIATLEPIFSQLEAIGINLAGIEISGGVEQTLTRGGFFGFGRSVKDPDFTGVRFDPENQEEINQALADYIVLLSKQGDVLNNNVSIALQNVITEGRTVEEVLGDLTFASIFDDILAATPKFTELEAVLNSFNDTIDEVIEKTKELGLSETDLLTRRDRLIKQAQQDFNAQVQQRILQTLDPAAAALNDLQKDFIELRRNAIAINGDILAVEQAFQLEKQAIIEAGLEAQSTALITSFEDTIRIIDRLENSLRLDPLLSGLNRQGLAEEAQLQLDALQTRIAEGDSSAIEDLSSVSRDTLRAILDFFGPTADFFAAQDQVEQILEEARQLAANTLTTEEMILRTNTEQVDILSDILDAISADIALTQIIPQEVLNIIGDPDRINPVTQLTEELTRRLKFIASDGKFDFAKAGTPGNTFADFVKAGNVAAGTTFLQLLDAFGGETARQRERFGFARGTGFGTTSGLAVVGEEGPEIVNFRSPVQIFSSRQSSALAEGLGASDEIRALRAQEDKQTNAIIAELRNNTAAILELQESVVTNSG